MKLRTIAIERLREMFRYEDGALYCLIATGNRSVGCRAGNSGRAGYRQICIDNVIFQEHRIIFAFVHGWFPRIVDHINGIRTDNRIDNLRAADDYTSMMNQCLRKTNKSGVKGVFWHKQSKKWEAAIRVNGKQVTLGRYNELDDAARVVRTAREKYHGEFANHG